MRQTRVPRRGPPSVERDVDPADERPVEPQASALDAGGRPARTRAVDARRDGIVAGRREGHRQGERHGRPFDRRRHRRPPRRPPGRGGAARRRGRRTAIASRMSELRTGAPSRLNGRTTSTSKSRSAPSSATAAGVPPRSWPKAASGVMRKPAIEARAAIESMNASKGVLRSRSSKCWTTVTSTPAAESRRSRSPASHRSGGAAPTRISSGWWSNVTTAARASRRRAARRSSCRR